MTVIKKYDLDGSETGKVNVKKELLETVANSQMVKDYIVALRANARQWSASTQTRAEVNHSGQKPHPQKGTGRARQGYLGSPQYKGGGRPGGPRPKFDQNVKMNRKEKQAVVRQLLIEKILENRVHVLEHKAIRVPKTKTVDNFLKKLGLEDKRVLFLGEAQQAEGHKKKKTDASPMDKYEVLLKSMRNIPAVDFMLAPNVSGYDVAVNHDLVIMESAFDELISLLGE